MQAPGSAGGLTDCSFRKIEDLRGCQAIAKGGLVIELPNQLFVAGHLKQLGLIGASMAVANHHIAAGQEVQGGDPGKDNARDFFLLQAPDCFSCFVNFQHAVAIATGNPGGLLGAAPGTVNFGAESFGTVAPERGRPARSSLWLQTTFPDRSYSRTVPSPS